MTFSDQNGKMTVNKVEASAVISQEDKGAQTGVELKTTAISYEPLISSHPQLRLVKI